MRSSGNRSRCHRRRRRARSARDSGKAATPCADQAKTRGSLRGRRAARPRRRRGEQAAARRGASGRRGTLAAGALSTIWPACMTRMRSQYSPASARSCVMRIVAMRRSASDLTNEVHHHRLRRHVEAGRRLVSDEQSGIAGKRHRDHHALAHAAGEFERIGLVAALRVGDAHAAERGNRGAPRSRRAASLPCRRSTSSICLPTLRIGLSAVRGLWKIIDSSRPRSFATSRAGAIKLAAFETTTRPRGARPALSSRPISA